MKTTINYCVTVLGFLLLTACAENKETEQSTTKTVVEEPIVEVLNEEAPINEEQPVDEPPMPEEPHMDEHPPMDLPVMPLPTSYFLNNTIKLNKGVNCMVAKNKQVFDEYFGVAVAMGEHVEEIDFNIHYVLALATHTKNEIVELAIERAELQGSNLKVWCMVQKLEEEKGYESTPIALAAIPKERNIKTVSFYNQDKLIRTVKL